MALILRQVDVIADRPFAGNPATAGIPAGRNMMTLRIGLPV
jgi:hypothetical protein